MRLASTHAAVQRIWTVHLRPQTGGPALTCPRCAHSPVLPAASARSAALTHLARHARADTLPGHLRTCQCRTRGCHWHPRHRGCAGPVLLALTCDRSGRAWRLADACAACAAAMSHTAVVPPTLLGTGRVQRTPGTPRSARAAPVFGPAEQQRVREMLTYLATALPCFSSPAARLLALQCALRADRHGQIRLPHGFLRSMRLHGHAELWLELEQAGWLHRTSRRCSPVQAQLLDAAVLHQAPGRTGRVRAAQWALQPTPLALPPALPSALRLTALALAAHSASGAGGGELDVLTRQCGQPPQQLEDLLDQLVRARLVTAWHHHHDSGEVRWKLPALSPPSADTAREANAQRGHGPHN
ncbi:hypothetical protein OIE78_35750 (plasmid) [Streptomyces cellulosae]|uniref:hypothetical protein n=1 Tax=Streptomyces cellulosae TaxID=1968 RepID=UPI002F90C96A|nr:hypothetical protein OG837_00085 [Streptomyces cellulosae]WTB85986.1 hypothetical protein OG837_34280 [Streptomyces cellulosae]WTB86393.1 hypothetical protein OG837_34445 [Streptomyces cellulosae]WTB86713.1 hypothetical protein OG837_36190 [Streptomyces cellulosae]WTB86784.1 hypothetical protein OIE99_00190 [Streptomyces cellulosae]